MGPTQDFKPNNDIASRGKTSKSASGTNRKNDVNNDGKYIEFSNCEVIGGQEFGQIREGEELNALLMDVLAAGRQCHASLCSDTKRYQFWVKPLILKGLIRKYDGSDSGGDDDDDDAVFSQVYPTTNPSLLCLSTTHDDPSANPPQEPLAPEQPGTTQLHRTPPSGLDSGLPGSPTRMPPTVDKPDDDLFTSVVVPPPLLPPSPPPSSTPAAVTTAVPPATEPAVSVASKKGCKPNPIHFTPRNIYMAVYADEVGGSSNGFTKHWPSLATENPGLLQAYETYSKELVMHFVGGVRPVAVRNGQGD
ncbi:hypothetical protein K438DRAFT_2007906, partial [Mycena galopus ATCC 62051]